MALLNQDKKYIKVNIDGSFDIYPTKEFRDKVKRASPFEIIKNKYEEIIRELREDYERQYYDTEAWNNEYISWTDEFNRYMYDYQLKKGGKEYPLIKEYYSDVSDSIPNILQSGSICVNKTF